MSAEFCERVLKFPRSASAKGSPVEFDPVVAPALAEIDIAVIVVREFCVLRLRANSTPNFMEWSCSIQVTLSAGLISVVGDAR